MPPSATPKTKVIGKALLRLKLKLIVYQIKTPRAATEQKMFVAIRDLILIKS